jgi:hypothetical protein
MGPIAANQSQLPGQVHRILHAGVHALSTDGTMDVSRVAGQKGASTPVLSRGPVLDPEGRGPHRLVQPEPAVAGYFGQVLKLAEHGVLVVPALGVGAHRDDPPRRGPVERKEQQRTSRGEEGVDGSCFESVDLQISEQERLRVSSAGKLDALGGTNGGVHAIAASEVAGPHLLKLPVWMAKRADDVAIGLLIRDELDTALYPAAASCQRLSKHRLGLCLRHKQQEGEPGVGDADVEQLRLGDPPGAMNAQLRRRVATSDQLVGQAHRLKHLERSRLNSEGTRLGNAIRAAVDDADRHSPALEGRREREAGRTGADHEHIAGAHAAIVADMARYLELWRHTDNDGDALTDDGIEAALRIGAGLSADYAVAVSTGAQRATQTLACLITAGRLHIPAGVRVDEGLRSDDEDRWRDIAGEADGKDLSAFRVVDSEFVEAEAQQLGSALRRVLDRLDDGQRALLVGHSPTNEAAVYGLTGQDIDPMDKGSGVVVVVDGDAYTVESA